MKKLQLLIVTLLFCSVNPLLSQEKEYQGLLWEISGNGLKSSSYLYGTMHVSSKLAFNVSDSFYVCLDKTDGVALESSPATWMEEYRDMGAFNPRNYAYGKDFYSQAFNLTAPKNDVIYNLLENKNGLMNQILYRFRPGNEDYQENTFLDMFIFQAGAKNNKPIFSLETMDEVMELSKKSMTPDKDKKRDNSRNSHLEKDAERKYVQLEEAYRRGDLDAIDSLSKADNPTSVYHKYFIVERNKNMVRRIDSITDNKSLFIGVGAAHLPGEEGMIELLRNEGFNVRAVNPKSSKKSHKMRKKLEALYKPIDFTRWSSQDGFVQAFSPGELFEMPTGIRGRMEYLCPEPINGGYFSVVRLFTLGPIFNRGPEYYRETFDSLLYIATPGELIKKEDITVNGHNGFSILTKTSKNAYVNYNVFFLPTEIIVFKGFGIKDYILKSDPKSFFSKIVLATNNSEWKQVAPEFGGANWQMKGLVTGQDMIKGLENTKVDPLYQSYDDKTGDHFMVMRYTLNDLDYIEEDSFDLAYLGDRFGHELGYDVQQSELINGDDYTYMKQTLAVKEPKSEQIKNLYIKLMTKRGHYYLMVANSENTDAQKFFDSFKFSSFIIENEYEEYEDTSRFYTVQTILEKEIPSFGSYNNYGRYDSDDDEDRTYLSNSSRNFHSEPKSGEDIYVGYTKFHNYDGADSVEGFWRYRIERLTDRDGLVVSNKEEKMINNDRVLSFVLTDTGSTKGIMTQLRLHHGVQYTIQALIDTLDGPSDYVKTFFETFTPKDTLIGRDIFEDKADVFFEHAQSEDSLLRVNSMKSITQVDFHEKDIEGIENIYRNFDFEEETEAQYRENLIMALGNVEDEKAYTFLSEVYDENNFNADLQFTTLKCFSYTETEGAYEAIKKHLMSNPPFTEEEEKMEFFDNLYDSLELAKDYFPEMLELIQYSDYHPYILELLSTGYLKEIFTFDNFKSEKKSIFRNANIELKRTVAAQKKSEDEYGYSRDYVRTNQFNTYHTLFLDYYSLMCGFKSNGDPDTDDFFKDIERIDNEKFLIEAEIIHHKLGMSVDTAVINKVAKDVDYRVWVYNRLDDEEMLSFFTPEITQEEMAYALLYNNNLDEEEDTVVFLQKAEVDNGKEVGYVYFYKRKTENMKNWMIDYVGLMPIDTATFETRGLEKKMGLAVQNEKETTETIEKTIEIFELMNRKRVKTGGSSYGDYY
jgi:uncharacterized protein YbaP (TraB family)